MGEGEEETQIGMGREREGGEWTGVTETAEETLAWRKAHCTGRGAGKRRKRERKKRRKRERKKRRKRERKRGERGRHGKKERGRN